MLVLTGATKALARARVRDLEIGAPFGILAQSKTFG
jgi:hypothetical protein